MRRNWMTVTCVVTSVSIGALLTTASSAGAQSPARFGALAATPFSGSIPATAAPASALVAKEAAVLTETGISPARAAQALDVQSKVAEENLPNRLQDVMASDYAGVWFDNAAAQLDVGVTSPQGQRTAQDAVAQAGLASQVQITPVRSTMAQLLATQNQWNSKLATLFAQRDLRTSIEPQNNAVSIVLSSSVPARQRAALKREAAGDDVNVHITVAPSAHLEIIEQAGECNNFATAPNCNPSLTSGVEILTSGGSCTAGPLAIPTGARTERVVLTAGHCIEGAGGVGREWLATKRNGTEKPVIGKAIAFSNGSSAGDLLGDFGDIKIEATGGWQTGIAHDPVLAVTAEWKLTEETRYPVGGERTPAANALDCHEGASSGERCGVIRTLNVLGIGGNGKPKEGLVEDTATGIVGDSGGPWLFAASAGRNTHEALMEGSHVGEVVGSGGLTAFDPLRQPVGGAAPGSLETLGLELLTTANEVIPVSAIWEVAGKELVGSKNLTSTSEGTFTIKATTLITIECKSATSKGSIKGPRTGEGEVTFSECSVAGKTSTECHVKSAGEATGTIKTKPLTTELVYLGTEKEAHEGTKLGDLLSPKEGKVLVEVEVAGTKCPAFTEGTQKVEGTVAAEDSPSGALSKNPKLIFPSSAIKSVYKSKTEGEIEEAKPGLTSFGLVAVTMAGTEKFELESKEEFGAFHG